jgi:hypothetical protein
LACTGGGCTDRTKVRTCVVPVAAGLANHFTLIWVDLIGSHGATCAAHQETEQRHPPLAVPRLTPEQVREVLGRDDAELDQAGRYMRQAERHGLDVELAVRARLGPDLACLQTHMTLALKCAAQSRQAITALAEIRMPKL